MKLFLIAVLAAFQAPAWRSPDVPYEPTPGMVVKAMLDLAEVGPHDVVFDLGCGDGRIVIAAARRGARAVCIDIDPRRTRDSMAKARRAGVGQRIRFLTEDLFTSDLREATVVMLFLWPEVNLRLRGKLLAELAPGTRIVSHMHDMGDWIPERQVTMTPVGGARQVYLWRVPPPAH